MTYKKTAVTDSLATRPPRDNYLKPLKLNYFFIGIITLLLALALWPSIPWRSSQDVQLRQILSRGELRISTVNSPLTYAMSNGSPTGLDYELAKRFADYLGVKLVVSSRKNLDELFDDLDGDDADLLAAGLIYNHERLERFRAGPTYYSISQQMVYRLGSPRPKTLDKLQGRLVVTSGSAHAATLRDLKAEKYPQLNWESASDQSTQDLLKQVADGKLDYTLGDSVTIGLMQRIHPQLAVAFDLSDEEPVTWYMRRSHDDSLSAALLDFFSQIVEDGTLARLEEKYLGHVGEFDYVDTTTFLSAIDETLPDLRPLFEKYATDIDWKLLAAISYQESHWNPLATSPTGVRGLMMLTRNTAESLNVTDRVDPEQSIRGGAQYMSHMMQKMPDTIPEDEKIWFALASYNMGYAHLLDARKLTEKQKGNPDSWVDVKMRLPMLSQKRYYTQTTYGYARGHEAYNYVENIRRYMVSLEGYLIEKETKAQQQAQIAQGYPAVPVNKVPE
ncbi:membrane-bound lytic murein transglycosylase MltF [Pectobacterium versatile]|uniref:membrane-bound lytic murein transglycosylase MltF n=1 Tax=Pectobacterium versatile TaxID=2488639 RepID=UPI00102F1776|nr:MULTISPECIES: membrane-bound lytic murein transglycosylase MltF [Pectobacterium]MBN3239439.1 membrane-bound lytic murein transglycosylase MltF [Pectobacterium versatile]MCA6924911.1 membrane-bound lytic murein transglycosylase MltF [Pectobacterium versatile]MCH5081673.1 membrane-bound lytic murein transglycosylase MltF [Pectobacterium versatile]MCL6398131.1 membrane-bound lytic murein transglycosylase MltF [Pectobacterium carotovorum subsp. carotovorum]TAI83082.1 membrane-bound lytic murein